MRRPGRRRRLAEPLESRRVLASSLDLRVDCGAVGDGVVDDRPALLACLAALPTPGTIVVPTGQYRIAGPVVVTGDRSLAGEGTASRLLLDAELTGAGGQPSPWLQLGDALAAPGQPFTGELRGLSLETANGARASTLVALESVEHFALADNRFLIAGVGVDIGALIAAAAGAGGSQTLGTIVDNTFDTTATDSVTSIELSSHSSRIVVAHNRLLGGALNLLGAEQIEVASNTILTSERGLWVAGARQITVAGNELARQADNSGAWRTSGSLVQIEPGVDSDGLTRESAHVVLSDNRLTNPRESLATYGIRLRGTNQVTLAGNTILSDAYGYIPGREYQPFLAISVEPASQDGALKRSSEITLQDNVAAGYRPAIIRMVGDRANGPIRLQGNLAAGFQFYGDTVFGENTVVRSEPDPAAPASSKLAAEGGLAHPLRVDGDVLADQQVLFEGRVSQLTSERLVTDSLGRKEFILAADARITRIEVLPSSRVGGRLLVEVRKASGNYRPAVGARDDSAESFGFRTPYHAEEADVSSGDVMQVAVWPDPAATPSTGSATRDAVVRVYGTLVRRATEVDSGPHLISRTVQVGPLWQTVELEHTYLQPVVVATVVGAPAQEPQLVQIQAASGRQFQMRVLRTDGLPATEVAVRYTVVEEGVYNQASHGVTLEAGLVDSAQADSGARGSWSGQALALANSYRAPTVLGQVVSANNPTPHRFWAGGETAETTPSSSAVRIGREALGDLAASSAPEQLAYIIIESGRGKVDSQWYEATPAAVAEELGDLQLGLESGRHSAPQRIDFREAGGAGDGVTNDAPALQAAIQGLPNGGVIWFPPGEYRLDGQLFVPYNVSFEGLLGHSVLTLDADLVADDPLGYGFWWNFGIAGAGTAGTFWSGHLTGLTFRLTAYAKATRALEIHSAEDFEIRGNQFDGGMVDPDVSISWVSSQVVNSYQTEPRHNTKREGVISDNQFVLRQNLEGGEQIGIGAFAEDVVVAHNTLSGSGDDCVGVHASRRIVVSGNSCDTVDGRVFVGSGVDVTIVGNQLQRTAAANGNWQAGGSYIEARIEGSAFRGYDRSRELVIVDNLIDNHGAAASYGIRLMGVAHAAAVGNVLLSDAPGYVPGRTSSPWLGLVVQSVVSGGATWPAEDVVVTDNSLVGAFPVTLQQNGSRDSGPLLAHGNQASQFQLFGNRTLAVGNVRTDEQLGQRIEGRTGGQELLVEGRVSAIAPGGANWAQFLTATLGTLDSWLADRPLRITRIELIPLSAVESGRLLARVEHGQGTYSPTLSTIDDVGLTFGYRTPYYLEVADIPVGPLRVRVEGTGDLPGAVDVIVRLYGVRLD